MANKLPRDQSLLAKMIVDAATGQSDSSIYDLVLADLRAKRERIDRAISAVEELLKKERVTPQNSSDDVVNLTRTNRLSP